MKVMIPVVLLMLSSTNIARGTFFGSKEKRGLFGFGYGYASDAAPVISVAHHRHLTYGAPITKIASSPLPYVEPVTKIALAPHPIAYGVSTISYVSSAIPYAAPWPRIAYQQPVAVTKVAYAAAPVAKFAYAAPPPLVTKLAYSAPIIKKFAYNFEDY